MSDSEATQTGESPSSMSQGNPNSLGLNAFKTQVSGLEGSAVSIIPERLTGENFREWSQSMTFALQGRG